MGAAHRLLLCCYEDSANKKEKQAQQETDHYQWQSNPATAKPMRAVFDQEMRWKGHVEQAVKRTTKVKIAA
jgi:hypothetical protein